MTPLFSRHGNLLSRQPSTLTSLNALPSLPEGYPHIPRCCVCWYLSQPQDSPRFIRLLIPCEMLEDCPFVLLFIQPPFHIPLSHFPAAYFYIDFFNETLAYNIPFAFRSVLPERRNKGCQYTKPYRSSAFATSAILRDIFNSVIFFKSQILFSAPCARCHRPANIVCSPTEK